MDAFGKVEFDRLRYVSTHQKELRSDLYQGVADALDASDTAICRDIGKKILPSSLYGGPRSVAQRYQVMPNEDSMVTRCMTMGSCKWHFT